MKSFPRFFTKQLLGFVALAFFVVIVDIFLYMSFAVREMDTSYNQDMPIQVIGTVDAQLTATGGAYTLSPEGSALLSSKGAWAMLIAPDGSLLWSDALPSEVPTTYSLNDVAVFSRTGYLEDYPVFVWARDDGLLVIGFPENSYYIFSHAAFPETFINSIPLYIMVVLFADLFIFFVAYMLSKRRTVKSIAPLTKALDDLSTGQLVDVKLSGDLADVADRINETSAIIKKKDRARDGWIRGISHDIRTPLSVITGYSDGIANDPQLPEKTRNDALMIRTQGLKIKDLVLDLNAASQLEFDMQPLHVETIPMAALLREVVAEYLNGGLPPHFSLGLEIDDAAQNLVMAGDRRLLKRAVQNLIQNALSNNPEGCMIVVALRTKQEGMALQSHICVYDNGKGMSLDSLSRLQHRLFEARTAMTDEVGGDDADDSSAVHGLGLVLVEKIVRAHGGVLQISSTEGVGFTARLCLPMELAVV